MEASEQIIRLKSEISQLELELNKKKIELSSLQNIDVDTKLSPVARRKNYRKKLFKRFDMPVSLWYYISTGV